MIHATHFPDRCATRRCHHWTDLLKYTSWGSAVVVLEPNNISGYVRWSTLKPNLRKMAHTCKAIAQPTRCARFPSYWAKYGRGSGKGAPPSACTGSAGAGAVTWTCYLAVAAACCTGSEVYKIVVAGEIYLFHSITMHGRDRAFPRRRRRFREDNLRQNEGYGMASCGQSGGRSPYPGCFARLHLDSNPTGMEERAVRKKSSGALLSRSALETAVLWRVLR